MPRAYCPECASEVPVDAGGKCHVGHRVDLAGASLGDTVDVRAADGADEPQPWVASVDPSGSTGSTPPPSEAPTATPDGGAWTPDDGPAVPPRGGNTAGDDLSAAAAAAVESLQADERAGPDPVEASGGQVESGWPETLPAEGDTPGWTPPTNDPVTPPPVPAPAPAAPPAPADEDDDLADSDFDLDDLAAAVSDLDMDDDTAPAAAAADTSGDGTADAGDAWEDDPGEPPADRTAAPGPAAPADAVDLSNFTAKRGKVETDEGGDGKKGGLFRRR